jgi:hypothetical protein
MASKMVESKIFDKRLDKTILIYDSVITSLIKFSYQRDIARKKIGPLPVRKSTRRFATFQIYRTDGRRL